MALPPSTRLGPYEIISAVGAGGMGEVYRARDTRLDRTVAIKILSGQFSERFEREARAVASLSHSHISGRAAGAGSIADRSGLALRNGDRRCSRSGASPRCHPRPSSIWGRPMPPLDVLAILLHLFTLILTLIALFPEGGRKQWPRFQLDWSSMVCQSRYPLMLNSANRQAYNRGKSSASRGCRSARPGALREEMRARVWRLMSGHLTLNLSFTNPPQPPRPSAHCGA